MSDVFTSRGSKVDSDLCVCRHGVLCPQEALDNLMLEGDNIVSAARRAIMRHEYSAVLTIFPILRHLKMNKSEFDSTLQVWTVAMTISLLSGF